MKKEPLSIAGCGAGPWDLLGSVTFVRKPTTPLPYFSTFIAAVWRVPPKKGDSLSVARFFWSAGQFHGTADSLDQGRELADRSLADQGALIQ